VSRRYLDPSTAKAAAPNPGAPSVMLKA
jgi:hypothetical protein